MGVSEAVILCLVIRHIVVNLVLIAVITVSIVSRVDYATAGMVAIHLLVLRDTLLEYVSIQAIVPILVDL